MLLSSHSHRMLQACLLTCHCRPFFRPDEMKMPPNGLSHTRANLLRQGIREQNGLSKRADLLTDILAGAIKVRPYPRRQKSEKEVQHHSQRTGTTALRSFATGRRERAAAKKIIVAASK